MMKKGSLRISAIALAALLVCASLFSVFAATYSIEDGASVFTQEQIDDLAAKLDAAVAKTGWEFIIYASNDGTDSDDMESHYDRYYAQGGFESNAIMLVIDKASDNRIILSYGEVKDYFAGAGERYDEIKSAMKPYLNSGDYYEAAKVFIEKASDVQTMGKPNKIVMVLQKFGWIIGIIAVAAGVVFFFVNRSRYKNLGKSGTYDLAANSDVDLRESEDVFVNQYTTVRTIREDNDSSSPSSDGHSSGTF